MFGAVVYSKLTPIIYTSVKDSGVALTIRYLCNPRRRRGTSEQIWERVLEITEQRPDIQLAYNTIRVFNNVREGADNQPSE